MEEEKIGAPESIRESDVFEIKEKLEKRSTSMSSDESDEFYDCENDDIFVRNPSVALITPGQDEHGRSKTFISPGNFIQTEYPWRESLPYLRPPGLKFSIWSTLKQSIGKEFGKFTVPVYFNEPISML